MRQSVYGRCPLKSPGWAVQLRPGLVLLENYSLVEMKGRPSNSDDLMKMCESGLYTRFRAAFGSFADFQKVLADNERQDFGEETSRKLFLSLRGCYIRMLMAE